MQSFRVTELLFGFLVGLCSMIVWPYRGMSIFTLCKLDVWSKDRHKNKLYLHQKQKANLYLILTLPLFNNDI